MVVSHEAPDGNDVFHPSRNTILSAPCTRCVGLSKPRAFDLSRPRDYVGCIVEAGPSAAASFCVWEINVATPNIVVSTKDASRLEALLASAGAEGGDVARELETELARAEYREPNDMPGDVVMMGSHVRCIDESTGEQHAVTLVYPNEADFAAGRVSILAPVGAALLGLSVGQTIQWPLPGGRTTHLTVAAVTSD